MSSPNDAARPPQSAVRRVLAASTIGTIMEWYDFYLYGFASALVFNKLFFPQFDALAGTLAAFGSLALGFFARPIGGLVFGHVADRIGRKQVLVTTMSIMGGATALIGLLPTYSSIGIWAAVLLTFLRICQGFAAGAEWGGAVVMAGEYAPRGRRGLYTSLPVAGIFVAIILSIGILRLLSSTMSEEVFLSWGWRIPFLLSVALIGVGLYIRLRISESPDFQAIQRSGGVVRQPVKHVIRTYPRRLLLAMGTRFAETGGGYVVITFVLTYLAQQTAVSTGTAQTGLMIAAAVGIVTLPAFGLLSDRIGRKAVYLIGTVGLGLFAFPYYALLDTGNIVLVVLAMVLSLALFYSAMGGPQPAMYAELFPANVRVTGVVAIREISAPIAGGVAPFIATALLIASGGKPWPVALYILGMCVVTTICLLLLPVGRQDGASAPQDVRTDSATAS